MPWVEVFVVFFVSHEVDDYMLQTDWQAMHKRGGLSSPGARRRALLSHIAPYTLAIVPALSSLAGSISWGAAVGDAAPIASPHPLQNDGRRLAPYARLT